MRNWPASVAALLVAVAAGCGGSAAGTEPGPSANSVNAVCHQIANRPTGMPPHEKLATEAKIGLVQREKIAAAAKSDAVDPALTQAMRRLNRDIERLVSAAKAKNRQALAVIGPEVQREADRISKELGDAAFKACATLPALPF